MYLADLERRGGKKRPSKRWTDLPTWCRTADRHQQKQQQQGPKQGSRQQPHPAKIVPSESDDEEAAGSGEDVFVLSHGAGDLESLDPEFYGHKPDSRKMASREARYGRTFFDECAVRKAAEDELFWAASLPSSPTTKSPKELEKHRDLGAEDDAAFYRNIISRGHHAKQHGSVANTAVGIDSGGITEDSIFDEYARRKQAAMAAILREQHLQGGAVPASR